VVSYPSDFFQKYNFVKAATEKVSEKVKNRIELYISMSEILLAGA
jgi:hypothetical protein